MDLMPPRLADLDLDLPSSRPFTTAQARSSGVSDVRLHRLVAAGVLRRLLKTVYVASEVPDTIELRCAALALVVPPDAFVCDRTAAWLHTGTGAVGPNEHLSVPPISCFRPRRHGIISADDVRSGQRTVIDRDLTVIDGLVVTTPLRTALDLGRLENGRDMALWGMDNLLSTGAFELDHLVAEIPRFKGERGVVQLRALAPLADGRSESFGESALRNRWFDAGLPRPELQISIDVEGREVARLDMGLPEWLFGAEYDGEKDHSEPEDVEHDDTRRAWLRTTRRWHLEVFRRVHVFGRLQDADVRLRQAALEARASLGKRLYVV